MPFTLPTLPYAPNALEPWMDAQTIQIHHGKHHQTYVDNTNKTLEKHPELAAKSIEELIADIETAPDDIRTPLKNHGGGHLNHSIFWEVMTPPKNQVPAGEFLAALTSAFGSIETFQDQFTTAALSRFGSGWAWLTVDGGALAIESTPNQENPISSGRTPILTIDVWEHAYYLKYQNRRAEYIKAWWNIVNWDEVGKRFTESRV